MNTRALHFLRIICLALLWPALVTAQSRFIEVDKIVARDRGAVTDSADQWPSAAITPLSELFAREEGPAGATQRK